MGKYVNVKLDFTNASTEELHEATSEARELFFYLQRQLALRKITEHKYGKPESSVKANN